MCRRVCRWYVCVPENVVKILKGQIRILNTATEKHFGYTCLAWIPRHRAHLLTRFRLHTDDQQSNARQAGDVERPAVIFGESRLVEGARKPVVAGADTVGLSISQRQNCRMYATAAVVRKYRGTGACEACTQVFQRMTELLDLNGKGRARVKLDVMEGRDFNRRRFECGEGRTRNWRVRRCSKRGQWSPVEEPREVEVNEQRSRGTNRGDRRDCRRTRRTNDMRKV